MFIWAIPLRLRSTLSRESTYFGDASVIGEKAPNSRSIVLCEARRNLQNSVQKNEQSSIFARSPRQSFNIKQKRLSLRHVTAYLPIPDNNYINLLKSSFTAYYRCGAGKGWTPCIIRSRRPVSRGCTPQCLWISEAIFGTGCPFRLAIR